MANENERAPAREGTRGHRENLSSRSRRDMQIEEQDEIESARGGLVLEEIGAHELGLHSLAFGSRAGLRYRRRGEVDADDVPPERCEPNRILTFAAGQIQRAAGREFCDFTDEEPVRLHGPEMLDGGVLAVPVLTLHAASPFPRRGTSPPA